MFALLLLSAAGTGAPPTFVVENKVPAFVVTSKFAPTTDDGYTGPAPAGFEWRRYEGQPWKLFPITAAPAVAAPKTFRGTGDGHQCPSCGRSQYVVDSFNRNGTHNHRCPVDGTVWTH